MNDIKNSKKKIRVTTAISLLVGLMMMPKVADANTYKTTSKLNLRTGPSTDQESIVMIPKNANVEYLGESGLWYNVRYGDSQGYISNQYVSKTETAESTIEGEKYSTTSNLNLRVESSTSSEKLTTIPKGKSVLLISKNDQWFKVKYGNLEGYVSSKYIKSTIDETSNIKVRDTKPHSGSINRPSASPVRNKVVDTALSLNGKVSYFWGGKTNKTGWDSNWGEPKKVTASGDTTSGQVIPFGIDCSGFIDWSFKTAGLGKSFSKGGTAMQWDATHSIKESELKIGDIAFKELPGSKSANHIGIYVGNNNNGEKLFIHSSSTQEGVVITTAEVGQLSIYRRPNIF